MGQMRQRLSPIPFCPRYQTPNLVCPLFTDTNRTLCRSLRHLQTQRAKVKRSTLKRLAIAALVVSLVFLVAYLESHFGITPNH